MVFAEVYSVAELTEEASVVKQVDTFTVQVVLDIISERVGTCSEFFF